MNGPIELSDVTKINGMAAGLERRHIFNVIPEITADMLMNLGETFTASLFLASTITVAVRPRRRSARRRAPDTT